MANQVKAGPVTVVVVMAPWCGHCHEFEPILDKAAATPKRSVQVVKVKDDMLDAVNHSIQSSINSQAKPIEVEGYPSAFLVGKDGNVIRSIEPVKDEARLRSMMENVGPIVNDAEANRANANRANAKESYENNDTAEEEEEASPVSPPNAMEDQRESLKSIHDLSPEERRRNANIRAPYRLEGGSLYGALSRAAYTLAPTAILLGTASKTVRALRGSRHRRRARTLRRRR